MIALPSPLRAVNRVWRPGAVFFGPFGVAALVVWLSLPSSLSLVWFSLFTAIANFFIPWMPHEPAVLLYGDLFDPWLVALVAGIATCWMELFNYRLLKSVLKVSQIRQVTQKGLYRNVERWFGKLPFLVLVLAGASPVPYAPFRVFAVSSGYPLSRYLLAVAVGRTPRYYVLALTGAAVGLPPWAYGLIFAVMLVIILWGRSKNLAGGHEGTTASRGESGDLSEGRAGGR